MLDMVSVVLPCWLFISQNMADHDGDIRTHHDSEAIRLSSVLCCFPLCLREFLLHIFLLCVGGWVGICKEEGTFRQTFLRLSPFFLILFPSVAHPFFAKAARIFGTLEVSNCRSGSVFFFPSKRKWFSLRATETLEISLWAEWGRAIVRACVRVFMFVPFGGHRP